MERLILQDFPITTTFEDVVRKAKLSEPDDIELLAPLFEEARALARPKVLVQAGYPGEISGSDVEVDGVHFESRILAGTLAGVHRVFGYVATCGTEIEAWSEKEQDYVVRLWLDMMKELFLFDAYRALMAHLKDTYGLTKISTINPGSGDAENWPIMEQHKLFALLGEVTQEIGVRLTDSALMLPTKSVSGFAFTSETEYINCALCHRANCPNRRADAKQSSSAD